MSKHKILADYVHRAWSRWMLHLFSRCEHNSDGTATIPQELVLKWKRQINTAYYRLSEDEKRSDLVEAARILSIVDEHADDT